MAVSIRKLRVEADYDPSAYVRGVQQKAAADQQMVSSARQVAEAEQRVGAAVEQTDRRVSASVTGLERLKRATIENYGASQDFERGLKTLNAGLEKNPALAGQAAAILDGLAKKYGQNASSAEVAAKGFSTLARAMDEQGRSGGAVVATIDAQAAAMAQLSAEQARAMAALNASIQGYSSLADRMDPAAQAYRVLEAEAKNLDGLLKAGLITAREYGAGLAFLAGEIDRVSGKTQELAAIEAARAQQNAQNAQYGFNQQLGVRPASSGSAAASASVFEEAARAADEEAKALANLQMRTRALTESIDPAAKAQRVFAESLAEADDLLARGVISYEQHARASFEYHQQMKAVTAANDEAAGSSQKLSSAFKLSHQNAAELKSAGVNLFQSFAAGMSPMQAIVTQAGQAAPAFAEMASNANISTKAMIAFAAPAAAAVLAVGAIGVKLYQTSSQLKDFSTMLRATGADANFTAAQLKQVADALVDSGSSRADANAVIGSAVGSRRFQSAAQLEELGKLANDLGVRFGGAAAAGEKLVEWLNSGVPGLQAMAKETGALSLAQYEAARAALQHGNRAQALQVMLGALHDRFDNLNRDSLGPAEKAMKNLSRAYDDLVTAAAQSPITVNIQVAGTEVLQGIANFLKDPLNYQFPTPFGLGNVLRDPNAQPQAPANANAPSPVPRSQTAAGTTAGRARNSGMSTSEAMELSDLTAANDKLLVAMQKTGAARQIAVAQAQAEIAALQAGKSAYAAEALGIEAARMARAELATGIADATAQLTLEARANLAVADAYLKSSAAGQQAEAMRQAQLDSLQSGVSVEQRYAQILNERATAQAATSAQSLQQMQADVAGRQRVAAAAMQGVQAQHEAELAEKVRQGTMAETIALEGAQGEAADRLRKIIEGKTAAILADDEAQRQIAAAGMLQQQKDQLALGQQQLDLMWASAEARAVEMARTQALIDLRNQNISATSAEGRAYLANAEALAQQNLEIERQSAAYQELERFGDRAMDSLIDKLVDANDSTVSWGDAIRALSVEFQTLALRMALINPLKNELFGTSLPTLLDFGMGGSGQTMNTGGRGASGYASDVLGAGSTLYSAATGTGASTAVGIGTSFAESSLGSALGLSTASTPTYAIMSGGVTAPATQIGTVTGTTTYSANAAGTAFAGNLGAIASGAGFGMIGGTVGGYLGTATNSNAVGMASGAALGAGSAYAASLMGWGAAGGPWGLAAAALVGAVMGLIGTKKPSDKTGVSVYDLDTYGYTDASSTKHYDAENAAAAKDLGAALMGLGQGLETVTGGNLGKQLIVEVGNRDGLKAAYNDDGTRSEFDRSDKGAVELTRYVVGEFMAELGDKAPAAVQKALDNSVATTSEEFMKDVSAGISWSNFERIFSSGYNPWDEAYQQMEASAAETASAIEGQYRDLLDRVVKLDIADQGEAQAMLRKSFEDSLGLGELFQPLQGLAAVTKQASIQIEALRPTLEALGYTAEMQADFIDRYSQRATDAYMDGVRQTTEAGRWSVERAIDPNWQMTGADVMWSAGLKDADFPNLTRNLQGFLTAADAGAASADDLRTMVGRLDQALLEGRISGDQYNTLVGSITDSYTTGAQRIEDAQREVEATQKSFVDSWISTATQAAEGAVSSWQSIADANRDARLGLLTGDMSPLSPEQRLAEARRQAEDAVRRARLGDISAAESVPGLIQTLLQASRDYNASSTGYVADFDWSQDALEGIETTAESQVRLATDQLTQLQRIAGLAASGPEGVIQALKDLGMGMYGLPEQNWGKDVAKNQSIVRLLAQNGITWDRGFGAGQLNEARAADPNLDRILREAGYQQGGVIPLVGAYAAGGIIGNGIWNQDSVLARYAGGGHIALAGGEYVMPAEETARYRDVLDAMRAGSWTAANDRWAGVSEIRAPRASGGGVDGAQMAADNRALRAEVAQLTRTVDRMARMLGDQGARQIEVQEDIAESGRVAAAGGRRRAL